MASLKKIFRLRTILVIISIGTLLSLFMAYLSPYIHPRTGGWLPFFGLGYIISVSASFILMLIWALFKSRWFFIMLGCLILGGKLHFRTFALGSDDSRNARTELNVLSYNVRLFDRYNPSYVNSINTRNHIFDYLKANNPDIVCFQEFYQQDQPTNFVTKDTLKKILESKDFHERFLHRTNRRQNFGIAMFSKYPIIRKGDVVFSEAQTSFNYCIYADIVKNKDTFRIYNVHLQSIRLQQDDYALFDEKKADAANESSSIWKLVDKIKNAYPLRAEQAILVSKHIKSSPYPVIVCGDFNDTPLSYTYNQFNKQLTDAFRNTSFGIGRTYAGKIPAGRIDYIFHSPELGSRNFHIQEEKLSDHYAISTTVFTVDTN